MAIIRAQADKILASGVLGRSRFYSALLEYLVACHERGYAPKEIEIAAEVFNRGEEFDPSQDSMVRVYAHNLRQKLQQFYSDAGREEAEQITIPKGEYRLALAAAEPTADAPATVPARPLSGPALGSWPLAAAIVLSLLAGIGLGRFWGGADDPVAASQRAVAASPLWSALTDDDLPVTVIVGDYFIFGELDRFGNVVRMVREFEINSSRDLDEMFMLEPETAERYVDLDLSYLPTSTASALRDLLGVLLAANKDIRIVQGSNLDTSVIRSTHVVYIGYLSGLGMLSDFVFAGSELSIGDTFDELRLRSTGQLFVSEAGLLSGRGSYRDYGLFSTMPGPGGNQLVFVAGMRDEGLMQTAEAVSNPAFVQASLDAIPSAAGSTASAFELLYEVAGMDRTNLDAMIVHAAPLAPGRIAIGQLSQP